MDLQLRKPGLFITATDTEVGKTVVTCAIAATLRRRGVKVGVSKPIASGCRNDREGLVSEDTEALAHFADCRLPLAAISPVRYRAPLAPAVAAESEGAIDDDAIADGLHRVADSHDVLLVEGIGGLLVPLDERRTVLELARSVGYPVVVVTRPTLGTLNHTAMTCTLVRDAGLRLAGLVINRYHADTTDVAEQTNARWLARQNRTKVLATVPDTVGVEPQNATLPPEVIDAVDVVDWLDICRESKRATTRTRG